jgi:hypothetical protein
MLPTILYLPKTGEPVHPGIEAIDEARRLLILILTLDDHTPERFTPEILRPLVIRLGSNPQMMEASRSAAREVIFLNLAALLLMTSLLHMAEDFAPSHPSLQ